MVTDIKRYNECLKDVYEEFRDKIKGIPSNQQWTKPNCNQVFDLDKPVYMYIRNYGSDVPPVLKDEGDHYSHDYFLFGAAPATKQYKNDFGWVNDKESVFFIERPFTNKVVRLLQELLPGHTITPLKNDILIDGFKIGPTCEAGITTRNNTEVVPQNSGMIYVLRWTNPEGLDKYFAGCPNHEQRKTSKKQPLGSLDMFLKKMTRQEFIDRLEAMK